MSYEEDDDAFEKFLYEQKKKVNKRYVTDRELENIDNLDDFIVDSEIDSDEENDESDEEMENNDIKRNVKCGNEKKFNPVSKSNSLLFSSESEPEKDENNQAEVICELPQCEVDVNRKKSHKIDNLNLNIDDKNKVEHKEKTKNVVHELKSGLFSSDSDSENDENITKFINQTPSISKPNKTKPLQPNNYNRFVTPNVTVIKKTVQTVQGKTHKFSRIKPLISSSESDSENDDYDRSFINDSFDNGSEDFSHSESESFSSLSDSEQSIKQLKKASIISTPIMAPKKKAAHMAAVSMTAPINRNVQRLDFISSLLDDIDDKERDFEAIRYRKNFKSLKKELALKIYAIYNEKVFMNKLPIDIDIRWMPRLRKTAGRCFSRYTQNLPRERIIWIELSIKVLTDAARLLRTLVHEMCHGAVWMINGVRDGHGPIWKSWTYESVRVFPRFPVMTRCHNYDIKAKYEYWCSNCQRAIKRHSKSIDLARKVCGRCKGRFTLFVNLANGERKQVDTQTATANGDEKKVSGFAGFVKEHYSKYRTTGISHGEVMKILGEKYRLAKEDDGGLSGLMTGMSIAEGAVKPPL